MYEKTLFVSDLDGTLLRSDQTLSEYTCKVINDLTENGVVFSYATARSIYSSGPATKGLDAKLPLITHNGVFIMENKTQEILVSNFIEPQVYEFLKEAMNNGVYPIVYALIDGRERFSYFPEKTWDEVLNFVAQRNDARKRIVHSADELIEGDIYYVTCIEDSCKIKPFYEKYKDSFHCIFQRDIYSNDQWLELMAKSATKAKAIEKLKQITGCEKVVAFGDGINDIEMFEYADEAYATANATPELKQRATAVIGSNDDDGVARWLEEHVTELR